MSNEKSKFDNKGTPSKLIFDNGKSYLSKDVFRGDYKGPEERKAVINNRDQVNHAPSERPDKQD